MEWKLVFSVLVILGPALLFGLSEMPVEMGLAIVAGALAAAFVNIEKIRRVRGGGFEAEMREVVDEAYATVDALRELAKVSMRSVLYNLTMSGRWGGLEAFENHALRDDFRRLSKELGIADDPELLAEFERFFRYNAWDHFERFRTKVSKVVPEDVQARLLALKARSTSDYPGRAEIETILGEDIEKLDDTHQALLDDYLYYISERELRRPEAPFE
jgi:hypothetical protein